MLAVSLFRFAIAQLGYSCPCVSSVCCLSPGFQVEAQSQTRSRPLILAVLEFGDSNFGRLTAAKLAANLKQEATLSILDQDQVRVAARGAGYAGSLNLSLSEARDLGAALGCDFYILGDAQTLRRSPSTGPVYFESYASIFLVSARTGRLHPLGTPKLSALISRPQPNKSCFRSCPERDIAAGSNKAMHSAEEDERGERSSNN